MTSSYYCACNYGISNSGGDWMTAAACSALGKKAAVTPSNKIICRWATIGLRVLAGLLWRIAACWYCRRKSAALAAKIPPAVLSQRACTLEPPHQSPHGRLPLLACCRTLQNGVYQVGYVNPVFGLKRCYIPYGTGCASWYWYSAQILCVTGSYLA